jgi:hypothetical protein
MAKKKPAAKKPAAGKPRARKAAKKAATPKTPKKPAAPRRRRGAPTKFHPSHVKVARYLCANGATNQELAEAFGVATSTISQWMIVHPDFSDAMRVQKGEFDARIERSLALRATGYSHEAERVFANGRRMTLTEHVPGDVQAQRLWLLNRRPGEWTDPARIELKGRLQHDLVPKMDLSGMSGAALAELCRAFELDLPDDPSELDLPPKGRTDPSMIGAARAKATYDRQRRLDQDRPDGGAE